MIVMLVECSVHTLAVFFFEPHSPYLLTGHEGEDVVLKALFRWLEYNPQDRAGDLPPLLRKVHLVSTSKECRRRMLDSNPAVQESQGEFTASY